MTPDEAKAHAYAILAAAEAAESDSLLVRFLDEKVGIKEGADIGAILKDFREFRERKLVASDGQRLTTRDSVVQ